MLIRSLKMSFWVLYDHLGKLLLVNFLSAFLVLVPIFVAFKFLEGGDSRQMLYVSLPLILATLILMVPLLQVGLLWMVKEIIEKHDGSVKTFFAGIRIYGLHAVGASIFYVFCAVSILSSIWFYGGMTTQFSPLISYCLGVAAVWALFFLMASAALTLPALVNKNSGVAASIKISTVLVVDNPLLITGIMAHIFILLVFCIVPPVFILFSFAPLAALQGSTYEILSRKYAAIQAYQVKTGRIDKNIVIDFGDENDEYLCRGFRDLLFPWKE
jgi:hypothetical protein